MKIYATCYYWGIKEDKINILYSLVILAFKPIYISNQAHLSTIFIPANSAHQSPLGLGPFGVEYEYVRIDSNFIPFSLSLAAPFGEERPLEI